MDMLDTDVDIIRKQRHDFMNDLQIIYGYLQLDKIYEARKYIDRLCEQNKVIGDVYGIDNNPIAWCLEKIIRRLWAIGKEVIFVREMEVSLHNLDYIHCINNNPFEYIAQRLESSYADCVYIYIYEDVTSYSILFCNNGNFFRVESCEMYMIPIDRFMAETAFKLYEIDKFDTEGFNLVFKKNER